jgi:HK97 family phage prohead protease/HK97 family phage major capsid protein
MQQKKLKEHTMQKTFYIDTDDFAVKSVSDNKTLKIAGYANTADKDRTGDIVLPDAWTKGVENFRRNPILLYQHDHGKPIGKINNITVDKKGIFVEASVSEAAEKQHGVKTLIRDGILKSFSVGFRIKDADYDKRSDTFMIKDLELLEISVVSVPANQNSLFSVRKSFEDDNSYTDFKGQFAIAEQEIEIESTVKAVLEISDEEEETAVQDPMKQIPFINLLSEDTSKITEKTFVVINGDRYKTVSIATADNPYFTFEKCDAIGSSTGSTEKISAIDIVVLNKWDLGSEYDIKLLVASEKTFLDEERTQIISNFSSLITSSELDLLKLKASEEVSTDKSLQKVLNDTLNLITLNYTNWNDSHFYLANKSCMVVETLKSLPVESNRDLMLKVYGHNIHQTLEEKKEMTTENVGDPITISTKAAPAEVETRAVTATVAEPRVAQLVEKAGAAVMKAEAAEYIAAETGRSVNPSVMEELAELKGQLKAYREQANALQTSKMHYAENTRSYEQFSDRDKSNAIFLAKALNKHVFNTRMGDRMKAVLTETNLNEAFSTNVYHEMQQQLVVAPMFNRIEVSSKDFRIPVADEDTSDFVAQFPSGSFAAGVLDWTTVPTSRQAQIGAVNIQPKKFMVATHIAKDEEEDTILPLIDFLRQAATRRLARGIDKAILRGDGTLSAFSASNALASAGAYTSVIKGVVELAAGVGGLVTKTAGTTTKAGPDQIAAARLTLGKYGLSLGSNLAYITSVEGYNNLVTNTNFQTVDKFGAQATYLTGSVGAIYGIPIFISEFMDNAGAADSNLGVLVYKPGFIIGERRSMEIESEYLPQQQVTAMYLSTRFDFKALTTVSDAALSARYSYAGLVTTASA